VGKPSESRIIDRKYIGEIPAHPDAPAGHRGDIVTDSQRGLLTGAPGVGKPAVIRTVTARLAGRAVANPSGWAQAPDSIQSSPPLESWACARRRRVSRPPGRASA